jgi:hypothetical protein
MMVASMPWATNLATTASRAATAEVEGGHRRGRAGIGDVIEELSGEQGLDQSHHGQGEGVGGDDGQGGEVEGHVGNGWPAKISSKSGVSAVHVACLDLRVGR